MSDRQKHIRSDIGKYQHLKLRAANSNIFREIRIRAQQIIKLEPPQAKERPSVNQRAACVECRGKRRLTRYYCEKCNVYLCLEHSHIVCEDCCSKIYLLFIILLFLYFYKSLLCLEFVCFTLSFHASSFYKNCLFFSFCFSI